MPDQINEAVSLSLPPSACHGTLVSIHPTGAPPKFLCRDGIQGVVQGDLDARQLECLAKIGCIQTVAKKDVEDFSCQPPVLCVPRQDTPKSLRSSIQFIFKRPRFINAKAIEIKPAQMFASGRHGTRIAAATNGGCANRNSSGATLNGSKKLSLSIFAYRGVPSSGRLIEPDNKAYVDFLRETRLSLPTLDHLGWASVLPNVEVTTSTTHAGAPA